MTDGLSYVHGASDVPLLGETVGAHFQRAAARWPDRPALIVREQAIRWTYAELDAQVDAFAAGLLALGLEPGDRVGIWSPNNAEWVVTQFATAKAGLILVNINPAYRTHELDYALNKVGCRALVTATSFKTSDYLSMLRELAPELATAHPGQLRSARLPRLETVIQVGGAGPGTIPFAEIAALGTATQRARLVELAGPPPVRRADQHPVHQRHHRRAQGGDAHPPQHPQQRLLHRRGAEARAGRQGLHPGPALPLLRHGPGQPRLHHPRLRHGLSRRRLRSPGRPADRPRGALHRALRCPHHVHRRARPPRVQALRPLLPCAPASWRARPARSRSCAASSARCTWPRSPSPTA